MRDLAQEISAGQDFPNDTPILLCKIVQHTAHVVAQHLPAAPPDRLDHVAYVLREMAQQLRYAERSRITQTPWSMVEDVEALLKAVDLLQGRGVHFVKHRSEVVIVVRHLQNIA